MTKKLTNDAVELTHICIKIISDTRSLAKTLEGKEEFKEVKQMLEDTMFEAIKRLKDAGVWK